MLKERFPDHAVLEPGPFPQPPRKGKAPKPGAQKKQQQAQGAGEGAEEGAEGGEKVQPQYLWCVSPLDGVGNYEHLYPFFAGEGEGGGTGEGGKVWHMPCGGDVFFAGIGGHQGWRNGQDGEGGESTYLCTGGVRCGGRWEVGGGGGQGTGEQVASPLPSLQSLSGCCKSM